MGILDRFKRREPRGDGLPERVAVATLVRCRVPMSREILYETADREEIAGLAAALRTQPPAGGCCACLGTVAFELEATEPEVVTLHHGVSVRWKGSDGDLWLVSPDAVMDWLSARGIGFVREEYEESQRRRDEAEAQSKRWLAAMPASLVPFFHQDDWHGGHGSWSAIVAAIEAELPDPIERARALFELFGSGAGPWSGYPAYESMPERLLLAMPLDVLLAAIGDAPDEQRREGAARLFSSWDFKQKRAADRAKIPEELRRRLLAHAKASAHEDNLKRARAALGR